MAVAIIFSAVTMASLITVFNDYKIKKAWETRQEKEIKLNELIDLSIKYPDSRDLLYRLAIAQWELGNNDAAKEALDRARYLDPNNPAVARINAVLAIPTP